MKRILVLVLCLGLVGCATLPGSISERISGFDKTKEIKMEPAWVNCGWDSGPIKLGLYKTSKMQEDKAILIVVVKGAHNFAPKESLQLNIDENISTFEFVDTLTNIEIEGEVYNSVAYIPPYNWSSKRYEVTKDFLKKLIEGKEVWVRVNLSREYVESKFSIDEPMGARPAFRKFYSKVWGL